MSMPMGCTRSVGNVVSIVALLLNSCKCLRRCNALGQFMYRLYHNHSFPFNYDAVSCTERILSQTENHHNILRCTFFRRGRQLRSWVMLSTPAQRGFFVWHRKCAVFHKLIFFPSSENESYKLAELIFSQRSCQVGCSIDLSTLN